MIGATGTTKGDIVLQYLVGSEGGPQAAKGGGGAGKATFIRDNNDVTLVEVINNSTTDAVFHYSQVFYEV